MLLAFLPGFPTDVGFFRIWAENLAATGPDDFYAPGMFHDYAPGYMWLLWLFGELDRMVDFSSGQWDYLLKLPAIAADLGSAYLLYRLLLGRTRARPFGVAALYLVLPPVLLLGAVWGQVDSILAFFVLLTIFLIDRERLVAAALAFTLGFLVKPQAIGTLPFLLFWVLRDQPVWARPQVWLRMAGASLAATLVVVFPFFPSWAPWRPFVDLADQVRIAAGTTKVTEFFAYNFWQIAAPSRCDVSTCRDAVGFEPTGPDFLGLTARTWGIVLFVLAVAAVIVVLRRARGLGFLALGTALSGLAFFAFTTRMHERYLFPFFLTYLVACVLLRSRVLWAGFVVLTTVHFLNVWYVYVFSEGTSLHVKWLFDLVGDTDLLGSGHPTSELLGFVLTASFIVLLAEAYRLVRTRPVSDTGQVGSGHGPTAASRSTSAICRS